MHEGFDQRRTAVSASKDPTRGTRLGFLVDKISPGQTVTTDGRKDSSPSFPPPLPDGEFELVEVDAGDLWISRHDQVMRPFMQRAQTWERDVGKLLLSHVRPGCRFLDVGANIGYFSILIGKAAPGVVVDSVEPDPGHVRTLRFNLWSNRVAATVWPLALDNRDRYLHLSGNVNNLGDFRSGHVKPGVAGDEMSASGHRSDDEPSGWFVPAASGDELFGDRTFDLVKIDVQGWEFEVLLGLDGVLSRSSGVRVVTEFWPAALRATDRSPADVLARYRQLGYRIRVAAGEDLLQMSDADVVVLCDTGGSEGQVNLLLER